MSTFLEQVLIVCLSVFFILPFSSTKVLSYFNDDFTGNSLNSEVWQWYNNSGQISVNNGELTLLSNLADSTSFPYVFSKTNIFPESGPFSIEIGYKYLSVGNYGDGLTISTDDSPANGVDPGSNIPKYITFSLWQAESSGLYLQKVLCNTDGTNCNQLEFLNKNTQNSDLNSHIVRLDYSDVGQYKIYLDGNNFPLYVSGANQKRPTKVWIGNSFGTQYPSSWSSFEIDFIRTIPYVAEKQLTPVVVVPGLGASWDMWAVLSGTDGTSWTIPSFVKQYDGLKNSLINAGYSDTDNKNLFLFSYDWRKPLDVLADKLNTYIEANFALGQKVNLIGHSMGGLVARAYAQKYGVSRINKVVQVGSPNMGTVQAYDVWEGATTVDDVWWEKTALEMTSHFGAKLGESKVSAVQRLAPSIKDLLPTYNFLVFNGKVVPWSLLKQKNDYLNNLNQNYSPIDSLTSIVYSNNVQTDSLIKVSNPIFKDILSNLWQDGKPIDHNPFVLANGDGTVTETSAKGPFTNTLLGTGWHSELVTNIDNIKQIFGVLGLDQSKATGGVTDNNQNVFVAALRSPGKLDVCNVDLSKCDEQLGGYYFPNDKLFIFPGYQNENLIVTVSENGEKGKYNLHLGDIDDNPNWEIESGNLKTNGQIDSYTVSSNGKNLFVSDSPTDRNRCKNDGWKWFSFFRFKNQGDCVSFVEKNNRPHNKRFWWF